jgi:type VI secretion system protein VasG
MSIHLDKLVEEAWLQASLTFGESSVRTGHLIAAAVNNTELRRALESLSREFAKVDSNRIIKEFHKIVSGSPEESTSAKLGEAPGGGAGEPGEGAPRRGKGMPGSGEALKQFATDMTEVARSGKLDPIVGRDDEVRQIVDILMRRRQNNPILVGEAGVGKTAVVEGFAMRIAEGDVPPAIKEVSLWNLDMGRLQAGAGAKGEFEDRLRQVIEDVQSSPKPIILFIDEAHTLIGAGGAAGTGDAANLLKPALARGTLRTVAATTWAEYKKYFEKDPALTRRFQTVHVSEPDEQKAIRMMRGLVGVMEKHHKVTVMDSAVEASVTLSRRYIPARQLPDKAVSLLDTACARVAISQHARPARIDNAMREVQLLTQELDLLKREEETGSDHSDRLAEVQERIDQNNQILADLEPAYAKEMEFVNQIREHRARLVELPSGEEAGPERDEVKAKLIQAEQELKELQGEAGMVYPVVDQDVVASVVADWTGIPAGRMVRNEMANVLKLADTLEERVIGQRHALDAIAKRIQISRAGLEDPSKPIGVFMLVGTSGVGKTETAIALAETMYGGEDNLITINMSEFQESHTVSTLKGAPPGYVGYGEGGVLTEAVRRRPYSVVLLDEVEKAHTDVHEIFFQVFDKGHMEDGEGRNIDFKNTVILLTSNAGSNLIMNLCEDPDMRPTPEGIADAMKEELLKIFPAALLGRLSVVPYYPLSGEMLDLIIKLKIRKIQKRVEAKHKVPFTYDDKLVETIAARCNDPESGARIVDNILTNTVLPDVSREFLSRMVNNEPITKVHVGVDDKGDMTYEFN